MNRWACGFLQAGTAPADGIGNGTDSFLLADNPLVQFSFKVKQFLSLHSAASLYTGMPVQRDTISAISSAPTSSLTIGLSFCISISFSL